MASATVVVPGVGCPLRNSTRCMEKAGQILDRAVAPVSLRRHQDLGPLLRVSPLPPKTTTRTAHQRQSVRAQSTTGVATREVATTKLEKKPSTLPEEKLIELAKKVLDSDTGMDDPSLLADDFYFAAPVIYLKKKEFLEARRGFSLKDAFPDLEPNAFNFSVDPYEPNRVWFFTRTRATHTGVLKFGSPIEPTYKRVESPPEVQSLTFNDEGKATRLTAGYVVDRRTGNTGGLGALFGILYAIGASPPVPEFQPYETSWQFSLFSKIQGLVAKFKK